MTSDVQGVSGNGTRILCITAPPYLNAPSLNWQMARNEKKPSCATRYRERSQQPERTISKLSP